MLQHMSPANDSGRQARPSHRTLTSGKDAVGTAEESFRLVNIYCYTRHFILADHQAQKAKRFFLNQSVNVNVEGCGWLVGTVVMLAKTVQSLTGSIVRVRYSIPTEGNDREDGFPNHPDYIRPL